MGDTGKEKIVQVCGTARREIFLVIYRLQIVAVGLNVNKYLLVSFETCIAILRAILNATWILRHIF